MRMFAEVILPEGKSQFSQLSTGGGQDSERELSGPPKLGTSDSTPLNAFVQRSEHEKHVDRGSPGEWAWSEKLRQSEFQGVEENSEAARGA